MIRKTVILICLIAASCANAWDWFGLLPNDESNTNRPPRLHRLLEKANDLIEQAEEEAVFGEGDKALSLYREAVDELDRVERENPERAAKPEFAPLRNKRATCVAAIETIKFEQINNNLRAITVSDSAALRKKYNKKHGIKDPSENTEKKDGKKKKDVNEYTVTGGKDNGDMVVTNTEEKPKTSVTDKAGKKTEKKEAGKRSEKKDDPDSWEARLKEAYELLKARNYADADEMFALLLKERPTDLKALLLRAAAQCGTKNLEGARRTLERANRAHPKSYLPYYNLAYVTLDLGEGVKAARGYYDLGKAAGGPRDKRLEARFEKEESKEKKGAAK